MSAQQIFIGWFLGTVYLISAMGAVGIAWLAWIDWRARKRARLAALPDVLWLHNPEQGWHDTPEPEHLIYALADEGADVLEREADRGTVYKLPKDRRGAA